MAAWRWRGRYVGGGAGRCCRWRVLAATRLVGRRGGTGQHLTQFVLPQALRNTVLLLLGGGAGVRRCWARAAPGWSRPMTFLGAACWPGRCCCRWPCPRTSSLLLIWTLLHPIGPVQTACCAPCWATTARASFDLPRPALAAGGHLCAGLCALPLCVPHHARAMFLTQAGQPAGSGAHPGGQPLAGVSRNRLAPGAARPLPWA